MRMRMCMHIHTDRQECSVEWKIALLPTRPCMLCGIFFFFQLVHVRFSVRVCWVGRYMLGTVGYGRWVYIFLLKKEEGEKKKMKKKIETLR